MTNQQVPQNSVWSAMSYNPPRGKCNFRTGLVSSCTCLRFMLHPVKAATSFDCDGCGHHASFHSLDNAAEDAILKKWAEQEANSNHDTSEGASKKRKRIADKPADVVEVLELTEHDAFLTMSNSKSTRQRTRKMLQQSASRANLS